METRPLTEEYVPLLAKWNIQLHEDEGSSPMTVESAEERYRRWLTENKFEGIIFTVNEDLVGYILFGNREIDPNLRASGAVYVRQFFIAREFRRKKYGTQAFNLFLTRLAPGKVNVILNVKSSNPSGQRFWESLGFVPENIEYELIRV